MTRRSSLPWLSLGARVVLAGVLGYAALTKIGDPAKTVRAVRAYRLLPEGVAVPLGHALPTFELVLAVLLLLGVALRFTGIVASVLMAMFVFGIASAAARGLKIDCGCFGGGGATDNPKYALELFRDGGFLVLAVLVALIPRSRWALDPQPVQIPEVPAEGTVSRNELRQARQAHGRALGQQERAVAKARWLRGGAVGVLVLSVLVALAATSNPVNRSLRHPVGVTEAGGILVGSATAPLRVVEYEDPQCPICKQFEDGTGKVLAQAVNEGRVAVEYRMRSFLGPESVRAVAALGAAQDEGRFEQLREQLYAHQPPERTGGFTVDDLLSLGAAAGLTSDHYVQAVRKQTYAAWARQIDDRASKDGSVGTPELWVHGRPLPVSVVFDAAALAKALTT